jgi:hypothetical protein
VTPNQPAPFKWTVLVAVVSLPLLAALCVTLWYTPFPISEAVALFEDVARNPPLHFLVPDTPYYRPLFQLTLSALWHGAGSLEATLAGVRLLQIVPIVVLAVLFIGHLRPRTGVDAVAAMLAVAVLIGSKGFRDNLEIPLSYTIVGMPMALAVWVLLNRERRWWHSPALVALTLAAIGFKEQGLVIVPVVLAAWWTGARSATRTLAVVITVATLAYLAVHANGLRSAPFEQSVGLGYIELEPREAEARFGRFPYGMYAYSGLSTMLNVLFSEPTRGSFRIVHDLLDGHPEVWQMSYLLSSAGLTAIIGWWGIGAMRAVRRDGWSYESRLFLALLAALLASGVLSFNYSRDRLGGMAVVFYALAAFWAVRAAAGRALAARRLWLVAATLVLVVLAAAWHSRAIATVEIARIFALRNRTEWLVRLPERRREFADRPVYLSIMESMIEQGTDPGAILPTRYPRWVKRSLGLP